MSERDIQPLIDALETLNPALDRFAEYIDGVNDPGFRERADAARAVATDLLDVHLPRPSFHVVVDLDSLFRAMRNLRLPVEDKETGGANEPSDKVRSAVGLLCSDVLDIQDAARRAYPNIPAIEGPSRPITEADKPRIQAALAGLNTFAAAVDRLREEEHAQPTFEQQGRIVSYYVKNMSLRIDTARLHLTVNDLTLDVPALVATVEATRQVSDRFRANVIDWKDLVSKSLPGRAEDAHAAMSNMVRTVSRLAGMAIGDEQDANETESIGPEPEMVLIPPGNEPKDFLMGIPEEESKRERNPSGDRHSRPQHKVTIRRKFLLGKYPVTRAEYAEFARATNRPWKDPDFPQTDRHPAVLVSHDDAVAYAEWLSDRTGHRYRLPTEAEWEYACRAGTRTARYWGDKNDRTRLHIMGGGTAEVGSYPANPWGLHDMLGNVREWCADRWHDNYNGTPPTDGSAWDSDTPGPRVVRGGAWIINRWSSRSGLRDDEGPAGSSPWVGFRLARTL